MTIKITLPELMQLLDKLRGNDKHDGCDGCKYDYVKMDEYPCNMCMHNHTDMYEKGGDE